MNLHTSNTVAIGQVYVSARSRSGRRWRVWRARHSSLWQLTPIYHDGEAGRFGGVKPITVPVEHLTDAKRWQREE